MLVRISIPPLTRLWLGVSIASTHTIRTAFRPKISDAISNSLICAQHRVYHLKPSLRKKRILLSASLVTPFPALFHSCSCFSQKIPPFCHSQNPFPRSHPIDLFPAAVFPWVKSDAFLARASPCHARFLWPVRYRVSVCSLLCAYSECIGLYQ